MSPQPFQESLVAWYSLLHDKERLLHVVKCLSVLVQSFAMAAYLPELWQYYQVLLSKALLADSSIYIGTILCICISYQTCVLHDLFGVLLSKMYINLRGV